jgi:hypothetical protein
MVTLLHRLVAATLFAGVTAASTMPVCAAPTRFRAVERQMPLVLTRTPQRVPHGAVIPLLFAPLLGVPRTPRSAPIKALALTPPLRSRTLPALLPFGLAAFDAARLDTGGCWGSHSQMLLTTLPVHPFAPAACERDASLAGSPDRGAPLVPGHNKNALYGPAYSFHDFNTP